MSNNLRLRLRVTSAAALLLVCAALGCGQGPVPQPPEEPPDRPEEPAPTAERYADLMVSAIQVYPAEPQAGQRFTLQVHVKNAGQAPSGQYDLILFIKDISRDSTYPIGTFRQEGMQPGEDYAVYQSQDMLVNYPGSHQVHVEIVPYQDDGDLQNNTAIWSFSAK